IGAEGIVLLKNNGILPLADDVRRVLVVGENAVKMMTVGGGSASLKVQREVSPLAGIMSALKDADVEWERGYIGVGSTEFDNVRSRDAEWLDEHRTPEQLRADALAKAKTADVVIFVGGLNHSHCQDTENSDRKTLQLPYGQDELIADIVAVNPNLIMVNISGTPVTMPWLDKVAAVVQDWYIGSEAGNSLADVLTGKVNPSGKLPFTFPRSLEDLPTCGERRYPGIKRADSDIYDIYYDEDIFVGYRWYDKQKLSVLFPFGYGLSYTDFKIGAPKISAVDADSITISLSVTNTGDRDGAETVQVYASAPKTKGVERENKKLVGFAKVDVGAGESSDVTISIPKSTLAYYDENTRSMIVAPGKYRFHVGNSSALLPHNVTLDLKP
ncbi:MAG: glycoside hydrolase family 3 C-terminal domain-containing protein, partial [Muribaculaceae bacterium]|nr:glycoside hydrolase family 3 C-terminal domain-containing protein [Muribaculaceae bacterium]